MRNVIQALLSVPLNSLRCGMGLLCFLVLASTSAWGASVSIYAAGLPGEDGFCSQSSTGSPTATATVSGNCTFPGGSVTITATESGKSASVFGSNGFFGGTGHTFGYAGGDISIYINGGIGSGLFRFEHTDSLYASLYYLSTINSMSAGDLSIVGPGTNPCCVSLTDTAWSGWMSFTAGQPVILPIHASLDIDYTQSGTQVSATESVIGFDIQLAPEPSALWLCGAGLIVLARCRRRRRNQPPLKCGPGGVLPN